ncbi:hypothetical protein O9992_01325 [Vibrio lentus]|nr:hypothetical protein [Vibrio lentus]
MKQKVVKAAKQSMAIQVQAMDLQYRGAATVDYGNNIRQMALEERLWKTHLISQVSFLLIFVLYSVKASVPFRWAALSGDPEDIYKTDQKVKAVQITRIYTTGWNMAREHSVPRGLPARICWVGLRRP